MLLHLIEVKERCKEQRATLMLERERVRLCRELRHARARLQLGKAFRQQIDAVARPLVESVRRN